MYGIANQEDNYSPASSSHAIPTAGLPTSVGNTDTV